MKTLLITILVHFSIFCFASTIEKMTLEEKIGQLLIIHFNGEKANEEARKLIQKVYVGGVIYYNWANGLYSPEQVLRLSLDLQKYSSQNRNPIPLFISVDQEGGAVARLTKGFTIFPGNRALGRTEDENLAEQCAYAIGQELRAVGVNFNFAPVVDVHTNSHNPIVGIRAFSHLPNVVTSFAKSVIQGYHKAGMIVSLKHFPGLGDVEADPHQNLPIIKKTKQQLQNIEFFPFKELIDQADSVMTSHIIVPSIDPIHCATLSKKMLDILRNEIGFDGIIISDSLVMEGLLKNCSSVDDAAIQALNAGCDILILGGKQLIGTHKDFELTLTDVERIHHSLVGAVKNGLILEKRVDEAVQRILNIKNKYNISLMNAKEEELSCSVNTKEHNLLAKKVASLALESSKNKIAFSTPIHQQKIAIFAPDIIEESIKQTSLLHLGKENTSLFFEGLNPSNTEIQAINAIAEKAELIIFCSYNAWENSSQATLIHSLMKEKKILIVIPLKDPLDATLFPQADLILSTFSPTSPSIQAACDYLCKISE